MTASATVAGADRGAGFLSTLRDRGFDFFTGVPCSLLSTVYPHLETEAGFTYVEATREDEAVGLAAGAYLAGRKPAVLMQNSGLGNSLNAIASLSRIYELPFLLVVSWRGFEGRDAPEHLVMGGATTAILDAIGLPWQVLDLGRLSEQLAAAEAHLEVGRPSALIVQRGLLDAPH